MKFRHAIAFAPALILTALLVGPILGGPAQVYAQSYSMPMLGFRWSIFEIPTWIQPDAKTANREAVKESMNRWYISQLWFIKTYGNDTGTAYKFVEVTSGAKVRVTFKVQDQAVAGSAQTVTNGDGTARSSQVTIDSFLTGTTRLTTIMHELGHVLGLGHVPELVADLMHTDAKSIRAPSTLDLYAVWLLSQGKKPSVAILPDSIPYQMPPQQVVAEVEDYAIAAVLVLSVTYALLFVATRRRNPELLRIRPVS